MEKERMVIMTNFYFENKDSYGNISRESFSTVVEKIVTSSGKTIAFPKMVYKPSERGGFDTSITIKSGVVIDFRFFKMEKLEEIKRGLIACYCGQLASSTSIKHDRAIDDDKNVTFYWKCMMNTDLSLNSIMLTV